MSALRLTIEGLRYVYPPEAEFLAVGGRFVFIYGHERG